MTHAILTTMTAPFRVTASGVVVLNALGESVARASYNMESPKGTGARIAAALNYTHDLTDAQLTEDSAGEVLDDRNRLLAALRELQANPNDPRAHRTALDAMGGR